MKRGHINNRQSTVQKLLAQLNEDIQIIQSDPVGKTHYQWMRNSEIQCFEYTIDTFWKLLKE